jgi:hypothetical protein
MNQEDKLMNRVSISQTNLSLFLISSTFLASWITMFIATLVHTIFTFSVTALPTYLFLYLFSLLFPAFGLLSFMKNARKSSPRWYWGIPLFIGLFLITFVRDSMVLSFYSDQTFIDAFDNWGILQSAPIRIFISIFFSLASALFCLSVPKEKINKMMLSFKLSIVAALPVMIYFIDYLIRGNLANSNIYGIHMIVIFFLGLSFVRVAINYER